MKENCKTSDKRYGIAMSFFTRMVFFTTVLLISTAGTDQVSAAFFQDFDPKVDTLIQVKGKVLNEKTLQPVSAQILFHRLPHGGNVGSSKVKNPEGDYNLTLMKSYKYTITLKADGYMTKNEVIETGPELDMGQILRDFYLTPSEVGQTVTLKSLIFERSKNNITPESYEELNQLVDLMRNNPGMVIQLEGHTDYTGRASLNMELSEARVEAVKDYLVSKGVKSRKIKLKAFGGSNPISRDTSDEARAVNRRVEVRILKK